MPGGDEDNSFPFNSLSPLFLVGYRSDASSFQGYKMNRISLSKLASVRV